MHVAILGAGGAGGYFGALLARAGQRVSFLARGEHLRAIREQGLRIRSVHGDFELEAEATDDPAEVGQVDFVLLTVKAYQIEAALERMGPLVGPDTMILTLQNGVEAPWQVAEAFGAGAVLGGAAWIISSIAEPGVIRQESQFRRIVFGELDGTVSERANALQDTLASAQITAEVSPKIVELLWTKMLFFASFAGIGSLARASAEPIWSCPPARSLLEQAMAEVERVARAKGIELAPDAVGDGMRFAEQLAPDTTSSLYRDVVAGRPLECDALSGAVVRAGREVGIATPIHESIWSCLMVVDQRARAER
ncbi:MAG: 2-dehydropantoate 2-reductase [Planctomycetota bacterium]